MTDSERNQGEAGLKVGLEIHQQLATTRKLFCECPSVKSEELPFSFERRLRPAQSEVGRLDPAAVFEFTKGRFNVYLWSPESSCLVEADEEPPHPLDDGAVDTALQIATLVHSNIIGELHVMRKIVIDGSNTTGFQRTAIVGLGGHLDVDGVRVGVQSITLEEDAARILGEDESSRRFALDRQGVPLVEIALDPIKGSPEAVGRVALYLGRTLRSTGRVARGLGTIRQDLNISVSGGKVVEVKGVQRLNLLPKVVAYEAARQRAMLKVSKRLTEKGVRAVVCKSCDASATLRATASSVIQKELAAGGRVVCISAEGLAGLLGWEPSRGVRLGREVAEVARANSLGGVIHSDEFRKQGISSEEEAALRKQCKAAEGAALVLLAGPSSAVERALPAVVARLEQATEGVPAETRGATDDGETRFMRPRPGAQRMYPETDIPDLTIEPDRLEAVSRLVPEPWEEIVKRYETRYSLSQDLVLKLFDSEYWDVFEQLADQLSLEPSVIVSILVDLPVRLAREGVPESSYQHDFLTDLLRAIDSGKVAKEAAPDILRAIGQGKSRSVAEAIQSLGLSSIGVGSLSEMIDEILKKEWALIEARGEDAFPPLMGQVMEQARGRADGQVVSEMLREKLSMAVKKNSGK